MDEVDLGELDRFIVYALQRDARHTSASDIAAEADVSPSTVRKHISNLEEMGIVEGYYVDVDYERAGYQLHTLIACTAEIPEREELARTARDIDGVVAVREVMTGAKNVQIEVVGRDGDDLSRIGRELDAIGLHVEDEDLIRNEYFAPFDGFASSPAEDE